MNNFRGLAPKFEQTFVKIVNVVQKPGHLLRMQQQNEPSVIFDCIMSASTTSSTLVAPVASICPTNLF